MASTTLTGCIFSPLAFTAFFDRDWETGNVIIRSYDYDVAGRKGTAFALDAIQVTKLVEYTGGDSIDFDVVEGHDDSLF